MTTYQLYLILLGYLAEHGDTEILGSILTELYKRAEGSDSEYLGGELYQGEFENR